METRRAESRDKLQSSGAGFTVLELMIALAIVGILSAIALPSYQRVQFEASQVQPKLEIDTIKKEQIAYFAAYDQYATLTELGYVINDLASAEPANGGGTQLARTDPRDDAGADKGASGGKDDSGGKDNAAQGEKSEDEIVEDAQEEVLETLNESPPANGVFEYYSRPNNGGGVTYVALFGNFNPQGKLMKPIVLSFNETKSSGLFTDPFNLFANPLYFMILGTPIETGTISAGNLFGF